MRNKLTIAGTAFAILFVFQLSLLEGVSSKNWKEDKFADFVKGKPSQTEIKSDGKIYMAPEMKSIYKIQDRQYIWASAVDSTGNIVVATGPKAAIYKISPAGKEIWKLALEGLEATAITIDKNDNVYAGVSPDGIIYKISSSGKSEEYFKTEQKYIWALCLDNSGNLYAGTGLKGQLFKITSRNEGSIFAKLPDTQITSLAINSRDEIFGGTDGNGYIFKVGKDGKVFILYDAPEKEIKSVFLDRQGDLYAAAIQKNILIDKTPVPLKSEKKDQKQSSDKDDDSEDSGTVTVSVSASKTLTSLHDGDDEVASKAYRSKLYKIDKDNRITELLSTTITTLFDIAASPDGHILICGGEKGRIYKVSDKDMYSLMLEVENKHLTSMSNYKGKTYICSGNEAEIYLMEDSYPEQAVFYSDAYDTENVSRFGTVKWMGATPQDTAIRLYTRSGNTENPDDTWSNWSAPYLVSDGSRIESPSARFIQWKSVLMASNRKNTPYLDSVTVSYLPLNDSPIISGLKISIKGIAVKERGEPGDSDPRLVELEKLNSQNNSDSDKNKPFARNNATSKDYYQEGALSFLWKAEDPNGDAISFSLYYKGEMESEWKLLIKDYEKNFFTWDTKTVPDGFYRIKITASDAVDTPDDIALETQFISEIITIDNTGPVISKPLVEVKSSSARISFSIKDNLSAIAGCKYSINGGKWKIIFPDDSISDTLKEDYTLNLKLEKKGEYTITFQAFDAENNLSTGSVTFTY
jgi:hypothetical protein